jgi:uncharacterized protein YbaP (TraB family)
MQLTATRTGTMRLALALLLAMCVGPIDRAAAATEDAGQKHFFWKVTGAKGVAYLFGTIHTGKAEFYPLPSMVEDRFKQADVLVEEVDGSESTESSRVKQVILDRGVYLDGDSIANHLNEVTRNRLAGYVAKAGQSAARFVHIKPWLVSMLVTQIELKRLGFDPALGLDVHFLKEAEQAHKPVKGLESAEFQLRLFSSFDTDMQNQLLLASLVAADKSAETYDLVVRAWQSGDADAMQAEMTRSAREHPELAPVNKKLFDDRNDAMTKQIAAFLQTPKTYFVAIGAGHLVGDRGVVNQLRGMNFTVEQP